MWELLQKNWATLVPLLTGALAVLALLPQPRRLPTVVGVGLLVLTFVLAIAGIGSVTSLEQGLFYGFSFIAIVAGVLLVTQTQPAHAALSFTLVILATCGLFLLLAAPFLFAATIIVYAGAIVVIFLFVLMLAQQTGRNDADLRSREPLLSVVTGFVLLGTLFYLIGPDTATTTPTRSTAEAEVRRLTDLARRAADERLTDEHLVALVDSAAVGVPPDVKILPQIFNEQVQKLMVGTGLEDEFITRVRNDVVSPWSLDNARKEHRKLLVEMHRIGTEALVREALVREAQERASPDRNRPLSQFSGPVGVSSKQLRKDPTDPEPDPEKKRPALPAENATYLGKSLFTDYLLPVELGGILLLVAVVGAIVIAQRQEEQGKEKA